MTAGSIHAMPSLGELQDVFAGALRDPGVPAPDAVGGDRAGRRFDVYRNNMAVGLTDVLKSTFPAVHRLVGEEYFAAAARAYVDAHPPRSPVLLLYGRRFGEFLDQLPSAGGVPYLGDVARLEWSRARALHAPDATPAAIEALARGPEASLGGAVLALHPSLSLVASTWPVVSLWSATVHPEQEVAVDMKRPEQAVVVRPALKVGVHRLSPASTAFLEALAGGGTLGTAANRAAADGGDFDLAAQLRFIFDIGAVIGVNLPHRQEQT